jgi:hypothetical protein
VFSGLVIVVAASSVWALVIVVVAMPAFFPIFLSFLFFFCTCFVS